MRVHTASFYDPQDWVGRPLRVSRQHPRGLVTQWEVLPNAYPTADVVPAFRVGRITAEQFASRYRAMLDERHAQDESLRQWVASRSVDEGDITLLCFERGSRWARCHRRVLARWLNNRSTGAMTLGMLR